MEKYCSIEFHLQGCIPVTFSLFMLFGCHAWGGDVKFSLQKQRTIGIGVSVQKTLFSHALPETKMEIKHSNTELGDDKSFNGICSITETEVETETGGEDQQLRLRGLVTTTGVCHEISYPYI